VANPFRVSFQFLISIPRVVATLQPWAEISERLRRNSKDSRAAEEQPADLVRLIVLANAFGVIQRNSRAAEEQPADLVRLIVLANAFGVISKGIHEPPKNSQPTLFARSY